MRCTSLLFTLPSHVFSGLGCPHSCLSPLPIPDGAWGLEDVFIPLGPPLSLLVPPWEAVETEVGGKQLGKGTKGMQ